MKVYVSKTEVEFIRIPSKRRQRSIKIVKKEAERG
jgi:hypothetical protein